MRADPRTEQPGFPRYLTFGCYRRKHLFTLSWLADRFIHMLELWRRDHEVRLFAFVVMANHVHLLAEPTAVEMRISLRRLKSSFAREALPWIRAHHSELVSRLQTSDHGVPVLRFWQAGGGHDRRLCSDEETRRAMEYIHDNPVRSGLVRHSTDYRASSARFWLKGEANPLTLDLPAGWSRP